MNDENLKPFSERSKEEAREMGRKGGKASGEARRAKKTLADAIRAVLDEELPGTNLTRREAIVVKTLERVYKTGKMDDLVKIAQLTGELQQNINLESHGLALNIQVGDQATAEELRKLKGEEEDADE
ncbi:MAG: hypothetical protein J6U49_05110 [Alistipes sp.]|nr:hypothetical protein [Alistipes sp.]